MKGPHHDSVKASLHGWTCAQQAYMLWQSQIATCCHQWHRRPGCRRCKLTPKSFDFVTNLGKIPEIPGKIPEYLDKIPENLGENGAQRCLTSKNRARRLQKNKWRRFLAVTPKKRSSWSFWEKICRQMSQNNFLGKFGQKFFAPPKICVLLHLCLSQLTKFRQISKETAALQALLPWMWMNNSTETKPCFQKHAEFSCSKKNTWWRVKHFYVLLAYFNISPEDGLVRTKPTRRIK